MASRFVIEHVAVSGNPHRFVASSEPMSGIAIELTSTAGGETTPRAEEMQSGPFEFEVPLDVLLHFRQEPTPPIGSSGTSEA